ncbi:hypothetical protein AAFP29_04265 [Gordonia sp. CPCC 205333]
MSEYHFHRLFVATNGVSPAECLSRRRIERARNLLRAANLTAAGNLCDSVLFEARIIQFAIHRLRR